MKKKLLLVFSLISFVFISWKFSSPSFNDPDKDKLLIEVIKYVLDKYHYKSIEIDDEFSKNMFWISLTVFFCKFGVRRGADPRDYGPRLRSSAIFRPVRPGPGAGPRAPDQGPGPRTAGPGRG